MNVYFSISFEFSSEKTMLAAGAYYLLVLFFILTLLGCTSVITLYVTLPKIRIAFGFHVLHLTISYFMISKHFIIDLAYWEVTDISHAESIYMAYGTLFWGLCTRFWVNNFVIKINLSVRQLVSPGQVRRIKDWIYYVWGYGVPAGYVVISELVHQVFWNPLEDPMQHFHVGIIRQLFFTPVALLMIVTNMIFCILTGRVLSKCSDRDSNQLKKIKRVSYLGLCAFLMGFVNELLWLLYNAIVFGEDSSGSVISSLFLLQGFLFASQLIFFCHWEEILTEFRERRFCWRSGDEVNSVEVTEVPEAQKHGVDDGNRSVVDNSGQVNVEVENCASARS